MSSGGSPGVPPRLLLMPPPATAYRPGCLVMLGDRRLRWSQTRVGWSAAALALGLALCVPGCVTSGKLLNLSEPWLPALCKGTTTSSCVLEVTEQVKFFAQAGE